MKSNVLFPLCFLLVLCAGGLLLADNSSGSAAPFQRGLSLYQQGDYDEAYSQFETSFENNPQDAPSAFYLGRIDMIRDQPRKAIEWLNKAVELEDDNSEYHHWLGNAYGQRAQSAGLLKKGKFAKLMKEAVLRAIELDPDNVDARFSMMQYYIHAPGFMGGSKELGLNEAQEIKNRDRLKGFRAFRLYYEVQEEYDLAEKELKAALDEFPEDVSVYYDLVYWYQAREKYQQAVDLSETILKTHPQELSALYQIGKAGALSGGNLMRAEACLKTYLEADDYTNLPTPQWAWYRLGMVYEKQSRPSFARQAYEEALKLDKSFKEAKKALNSLE